jgi:hypothetical protein
MNNQLKNICKVGQGSDCCRYVVAGVGGITCAKLVEELKTQIDKRVAMGKFSATSDNCEGKEESIDLSKL